MEQFRSPGTPEHEPQQQLVLRLDLISKDMLPEAGGKAANLGELLRAGLPVPGGFCVTTEAYRQAMAPAGLEQVHRGTRRDRPR